MILLLGPWVLAQWSRTRCWCVENDSLKSETQIYSMDAWAQNSQPYAKSHRAFRGGESQPPNVQCAHGGFSSVYSSLFTVLKSRVNFIPSFWMSNKCANVPLPSVRRVHPDSANHSLLRGQAPGNSMRRPFQCFGITTIFGPPSPCPLPVRLCRR